MLSCKVYDSIHDEELKTAWLRLQDGCDMTAFQHYDWYVMQEKAFLQNTIKKMTGYIRYFAVQDDDQIVLIAPLHIQKYTLKIRNFGYEKGVYFLGMKGYSDYLNFIYDECTQEQMVYLLEQIRQRTKITSFIFTQIPERAVSGKCLQQLNARIISSENCVKLHISESLDVFAAGIKKNLRANLSKQKNRYSREGFTIDTELYVGKVTNDEIRSRIYCIHSDRFRKKNTKNFSIYLSRVVNLFKKPFDEIQYALEHNPNSWLLVGRNNKKIIVYFFGLKDMSAVRIMQLGFDSAFARYMPGNITLLKYIRDNYMQLSGSCFDFTRGEERYKYEIGGVQHRIYDYSIEID